MRLLVACSKCQRQYDATGREVGSRFQCRCGEVLTVNQPESHESAVVRCASCGAPRHDGSRRCEFCNADFTLHEQDLDTICPKCFARVSDHARFCDHCGKPLAAEPLGNVDTLLTCPVCRGDRRLFSRTVGGFGIMECRVCAGLWIESGIFQQLIDHARQSCETAEEWLRTDFSRHLPTASHAGGGSHGYLPCPVCSNADAAAEFRASQRSDCRLLQAARNVVRCRQAISVGRMGSRRRDRGGPMRSRARSRASGEIPGHGLVGGVNGRQHAFGRSARSVILAPLRPDRGPLVHGILEPVAERGTGTFCSHGIAK